MLKVSEILRVKGNALFTTTPDTPVTVAIQTMSEQDIGSLVIMEAGMLVGMLTFREIIRHMHKSGGALGDATTIRGIMDDVISFYDMAQAIVAAQQFENNMLKAYIRDWPMDSSETEGEPQAEPTKS